MATTTKVTFWSKMPARALSITTSLQLTGKMRGEEVTIGTCQVSLKKFPGNSHITFAYIKWARI